MKTQVRVAAYPALTIWYLKIQSISIHLPVCFARSSKSQPSYTFLPTLSDVEAVKPLSDVDDVYREPLALEVRALLKL